ncbi:MAG TPA: peptidylprolyl isomerase [Steroidobacteraceae bacterium]|nr:peptidylprolyl isomerase [Steroidobacteraceae bacterium]
MNYPRILLLAVALAAALSACQPKTAATGDTSPPVAIVDGVPISRDFYEFYVKGITGGKNSSDLNAQQRAAALDNLIRGRLVGEEATKEGLDKSGDTAYLLQLSRLNVLQQAVEERYLKDRKPTEQELRAEYETQLAAMPKTEYHARHILVATEPYAQKIIDRLDKGEKFDALAKSDSMDSSKNNGGDLGWFTANRMVPEFAGAVIALKPGEYTHKPVQTQFGWHVIQLLETRELTPPPYDQVRQRLEQVVEAKKFRLYTDELMHNAKIEKFLDQTAPSTQSPGATSPQGLPPAAPASAAPPPAAPAPSAPAPSATAPAAPAPSQAPPPSGSPPSPPPKN